MLDSPNRFIGYSNERERMRIDTNTIHANGYYSREPYRYDEHAVINNIHT